MRQHHTNRIEKTLRDTLEFHDRSITKLMGSRKDHTGWSHETMEGFVLDHGRYYDAQALPEGIEEMEFKMCFGNAWQTATIHGLRYVEGYAFGSSGILLPILHAWCADDEGRVIDPTWSDPEVCAYLGCEFDLSDVRVPGRSVIDDWENGWPVLTGQISPVVSEAACA